MVLPYELMEKIFIELWLSDAAVGGFIERYRSYAPPSGIRCVTLLCDSYSLTPKYQQGLLKFFLTLDREKISVLIYIRFYFQLDLNLFDLIVGDNIRTLDLCPYHQRPQYVLRWLG